jgi:hypothetical protein
MTTDTALSDFIHQIYDDCGGKHAIDGLLDGIITIEDVQRLHQGTVDAYLPEIHDLLTGVSLQAQQGSSWQVYMRDAHVDSNTVTELLVLGCKAGYVHSLSPGRVKEMHLNVSIFEQPWYYTTGL